MIQKNIKNGKNIFLLEKISMNQINSLLVEFYYFFNNIIFYFIYMGLIKL